jgi:PTH2 family peptidyl-tRNA hydrolase
MDKGEFEYKLVVVARGDLGLSSGKLAVQVAHASVSCALATQRSSPRLLQAWLDEGQRKVVLKASSLKELQQLKRAANDLGIFGVLISDAGLTEIPPGTTTCLGLGPDKENVINRITGSLPLL